MEMAVKRHVTLLRRESSAESWLLLLQNKGNLLPLSVQKIKRLAIVGHHARERIISGGGSAALKATYIVTPWDGITEGAPEGLIIDYELGCYG
jgi:beta-glucosidase